MHAYHCAQLSYTAQNSSDNLHFPLDNHHCSDVERRLNLEKKPGEIKYIIRSNHTIVCSSSVKITYFLEYKPGLEYRPEV